VYLKGCLVPNLKKIPIWAQNLEIEGLRPIFIFYVPVGPYIISMYWTNEKLPYIYIYIYTHVYIYIYTYIYIYIYIYIWFIDFRSFDIFFHIVYLPKGRWGDRGGDLGGGATAREYLVKWCIMLQVVHKT